MESSFSPTQHSLLLTDFSCAVINSSCLPLYHKFLSILTASDSFLHSFTSFTQLTTINFILTTFFSTHNFNLHTHHLSQPTHTLKCIIVALIYQIVTRLQQTDHRLFQLAGHLLSTVHRFFQKVGHFYYPTPCFYQKAGLIYSPAHHCCKKVHHIWQIWPFNIHNAPYFMIHPVKL